MYLKTPISFLLLNSFPFNFFILFIFKQIYKKKILLHSEWLTPYMPLRDVYAVEIVGLCAGPVFFDTLLILEFLGQRKKEPAKKW